MNFNKNMFKFKSTIIKNKKTKWAKKTKLNLFILMMNENINIRKIKIKLWCKTTFQIGVEKIENNEKDNF
jgi:hypothetical protein